MTDARSRLPKRRCSTPGVEGRAALGVEVGVALREEGLAVRLEEARLLDPHAGARPEGRGVLAVAQAHGESGARHGVRPVAAVSLDAPAHRQVRARAQQQAVLRVGPEVRALRRQQLLGAVAEIARLVLDLAAGGQEVPRPDREVGLVPGVEPRRPVLEAGRVREVEEREGPGRRRPTPGPTGRSRPGSGRAGPCARSRRSAAARGGPRRGAPRRRRRGPGARRTRPDRAGRTRSAPASPWCCRRSGRPRARPCASRSCAPAESAAAVCSKRLFGSSLSVVRRCTPAFQSKRPRAPDVAHEPALPVEGAALALGAERRALARARAAGLQAHDTGQRVVPVEAARRAAHDLDPLELERQDGAEVEGAARLVDRHPVHEHAGVARLAPADEHRALEARLPGAGGGDAGHLLEERQQRRRGPVVDALAVEHVGGDAERRQRGLAARGAHDHVLGDGGRGEDEVEPALAGADRGRRRRAQLEAGRVDRRGVLAGREPGGAEGPVGPGGHAALAGRAVEGHGDAGEREAVARADDALRATRWAAPGRRDEPPETRSQDDEKGNGAEGKPSASSREKPLARRSGQVSWLPGRRHAPDLPRVSPSGGALQAPLGAGSPATVAGPRRPSTCFPFTLPQREAP